MDDYGFMFHVYNGTTGRNGKTHRTEVERSGETNLCPQFRFNNFNTKQRIIVNS